MKEKATVARRLAENRRFEKECRMKHLMGSSTPTMRGTELFLQAGPKYLFGGQQVVVHRHRQRGRERGRERCAHSGICVCVLCR